MRLPEGLDDRAAVQRDSLEPRQTALEAQAQRTG